MKHTSQLVIAMLLSAVLFALTLAPTSARPFQQTGQPPRIPPGPHRQVQIAGPTAVITEPIAAWPSSTVPGWSRLAFQSYRDGNWEIYRANADGTGQARLTTGPATDYSPRLSPNAQRLAFVSDRNGPDFDVFVFNWDGTGLTALTDNTFDDVAPAWSPNGARVAFESYRDGQAEVYVMDASGAGPARLTNDSAYDGTPVWSPDGAKIAFTSKRTGSYQVWVMNADGSDQHPLTNHRNAYDPAWSPDGSQIAYDADADGDGLEELWVMAADGSGQRPVHDPPLPNQVAWARSWSADGRYVSFSRLTYVGSFTSEAIIAAWDSFDPSAILSLSPGIRDMNPDWRATLDPDLWVSQSLGAALPGEQVDLELVYGNRGTIAARTVQITQELPAGLAFVSADPPPNATSPVLRWNKSLLPPSSSQSLIRITVRVDGATPPGTSLTTTAGITSATDEPDLDNNTVAARVLVNRLGYLPVVIK